MIFYILFELTWVIMGSLLQYIQKKGQTVMAIPVFHYSYDISIVSGGSSMYVHFLCACFTVQSFM